MVGAPRRGLPLAVLLLGLLLAISAPAGAQRGMPTPEPGFAAPQLANATCADRTYPECRRLRFTYGPLVVTPGNNAQMYGPVTIEKPAYDGYVLRVQPDLLRADGKPPPVDVVHLHHGTWISFPQYGSSFPFFAAGEEKTVSVGAPGYGMLVRASDAWALNYMLHNATTEAETLWITYDVDFVPRTAAERRGIKPVLPIWLDVLHEKRTLYPVFNVQKGYGRVNKATGQRECAYPRDRCAAFDPFGEEQPGNGKGWDFTVPKRLAGTIIGMGGHVHPGGLRDEVSVIRQVDGREKARRIFNSEAVYFDPLGPVSWDLSMTVTPPEWRVKVRPGDKLRLNAVYETERASWYEGMGIVMAFVSPGEESGVDPFTRVRVQERRRKRVERGSRLGGGKARAGRRVRGKARKRPRYRYVPIPLRGPVTHGHLSENSNYGGLNPRPLPDRDGPQASRVTIANFAYAPGDLSRVDREGIPRVKLGGRLTFDNVDAAGSIWHTITSCAPPCTATTGISYPLADDDANFDSLELGYGLAELGSPTANRHDYSLEPRKAGLRSGRTYTYFCRIHPFMRGAFKVVE